MASSPVTRQDSEGQKLKSVEENKNEDWRLVNWVQKEKKKMPKSEWGKLILA